MTLTLQHVTTSQGIEFTATDVCGSVVGRLLLSPGKMERLFHLLAASLQWLDDDSPLAQLATQTATEPSPANHEPE